MTEEKRNISLWILVLAALYFLILLAPIDYPSNLWGVNQLTYVGWDARIIILIASILLPLITFGLVEHVNLSSGLRRLVLNVVAPLLAMATFYLLRTPTHYLGDGILRSREIELGVWYLPTEPLGVLVNYLVYGITRPLLGFNTIQAMATLSIIAGALYYYVTLYLAKSLFKQPLERALAFFLIFFSGTSLLFCGYVESYSLLPVGIVLFFALGINAIERQRNLGMPALVYLILVAFHFANLLLAPCLVVLSYAYHKKRKKLHSLLMLLAILLSVAVVVLIKTLTTHVTLGLGSLLIPLLPGAEPYWFLSGQHLLDLGNELLLTAAPALVLLVAMIVARVKLNLRKQLGLLFVLAAVPGAILFLSLLDPKLGYASDWDLFSLGGVIVSVAAVVTLARIKRPTIKRSAAVALAATGVLAFVSYAAVNADFDKSIDRVVDVLSIYGERAGVGFESMGNDLNKIGHKDLAERMWRRAVRKKPHRRTYSNLGQLMATQGRYSEAEYFLSEGIKLDSMYAPLHMILGKVYAEEGKSTEAEAQFRLAVALNPNEGAFRHNLAHFLVTQGRFAEAEAQAREAVRLESTNANFICGLGVCLAALRKSDEAKQYFLAAERLRPGMPQASYGMARLLASLGDKDGARRLVENYLQSYPNNSQRSLFDKFLRELSDTTGVPAGAGGEAFE